MTEGDKKLPLKVILHVGRHKTGTTSIQGFLALNEELLAAQYGVLYPAIGRDPDWHYHHPLFRSLIVDNQPIDKKKVAAMLAEAGKRGCHTLLLSSEMLSRPDLSDEQLTAVRDAFAGHELKIILYFRRQDAFMESRYSERVKKGLLAAPKTIFDIEQTSLNYYQFAERYKSIFGKDALIIRSYDMDKAPGLFKSFLSIIDIPLSDAFETPKGSLNERYSWRYIELIRQFNRWKWIRRLAVNRYIRFIATTLTNWLPQLMNEPQPLSEEQRRQVIARYQASNEQLGREHLDGENLF